MKRKTFDGILTLVGLGITVFLIVAGSLGLWAYSFANSNVHNQLARAADHLPAGGGLPERQGRHRDHPEHDPGRLAVRRPAADRPASRPRPTPTTSSPCTSRRSAAARRTPQLSAEAMALPKGSPEYTAAEAKVQTVFQGTTLRGLLLEAYAFWQMGQIALYAAIACFVLAAIMLIFTDPRLRALASHAGGGRDLSDPGDGTAYVPWTGGVVQPPAQGRSRREVAGRVHHRPLNRQAGGPDGSSATTTTGRGQAWSTAAASTASTAGSIGSRVAHSGMFPCLRLGRSSRLDTQQVEAADQDPPGLGRVDHVVDVAPLGRHVGIGVALGVLLDQLLAAAHRVGRPRPGRAGRRSRPRPRGP